MWNRDITKPMRRETFTFVAGVSVGLCLFFLVGLLFGFVRFQFSSPGGTPLGPTPAPAGPQCTMEAKMCPDGSAVGRTGPACEFAPCPGESGAVTDFDSCVAAGHPVMESYPRQCAAGGQTYVETIR